MDVVPFSDSVVSKLAHGGSATPAAVESAIGSISDPLLQLSARAATQGSLEGWLAQPPSDYQLPTSGYTRTNYDGRTFPLHERLLEASENTRGGAQTVRTRFKLMANTVCGELLPNGEVFPKKESDEIRRGAVAEETDS